MSFVDGNGGLSAADVAAVTGNNGFGFGGDGAWWLIVLFLFAFNGNGWGNGGMNGGGWFPWMMGNNDVQRGFDQQSIMSGISGINASLANAEISRCNSQANILQAMNTNQVANTAGMNAIAMALQNGFGQNAASTADLKYTVATEACADRSAVTNGVRDIVQSHTAGIQTIMDKLCQLEMAGKDTRIADLERQLTMANLAASQNAQTSQILADNAAQTAQLMPKAPIPAYVVQNPNCCGQGYFNGGCGCNVA